MAFVTYLGKLTGGLIINKYQSKYLRNTKNTNVNMNNLDTIIHDKIKINKSNKVKKIILLFISSILDVIELSVLPFYTIKYKELSTSLQIRLYGSVVIVLLLYLKTSNFQASNIIINNYIWMSYMHSSK